MRDLTCQGRGRQPADTLTRVQVRVRLFAALRERAGSGALEVELRDGATVADVWPRARARRRAGRASLRTQSCVRGAQRQALQRRRRGRGDPTGLGRRLPALRETLSRWTPPSPRFATTRPVRSRRSSGRRARTRAGATSSTSNTRPTRVWPNRSWRSSLPRSPSATSCARSRSTTASGRVDIGETSVVIAVSAPHRAAALAACHEAIDELKVSVPLWKKETYVGGEEWIGQGS